MIVHLLQYCLPTEEKTFYDIDIDDRCQEKYEQIVSSGCWLFVERNNIGAVLLYIENDFQTIDVSASRGGYWDNKTALERMIMNFDPLKITRYEAMNKKNKHDVQIAPCAQSARS